MMTMATGEGKDDASSGDGADAEAGAVVDDISADAAGNIEPSGAPSASTETIDVEMDDSGAGNQQSGDTANLTEEQQDDKPADDASDYVSAGAVEEGKAEDNEDVSDGNPVPTSNMAVPEPGAQAEEAVVQQRDDQPSTLEEGISTQQAAAAAAAIDDPQQTAEEGANNTAAQTSTAAAAAPEPNNEATPWYKKPLILVLLFVIVALAAAIVGIVVSQNNSNNGGVDSSELKKAPQQPTDLAPSSSPSNTPVLLGIPSPTVPTTQQSNDALIDKTTTSSSEEYETATSNTNEGEGGGGRIIEFTVANLNTNAQNCTHIPNTQILQCIPSHNYATNKFRIQLYPEWAPIGVQRFVYLTVSNFWNGVRIFRIVPNFVSQFGLSPDPAIQMKWNDMGSIEDDPSGVVSNARGMVSFATSGPNARTTQVFINTVDNPYLDDQGFSPIGQVLPAGDGYGGMEVIDEFYSGYGGKPSQTKIRDEGEAYLSQKYPLLSYFVSAEFVEDDLFAL